MDGDDDPTEGIDSKKIQKHEIIRPHPHFLDKGFMNEILTEKKITDETTFFHHPVWELTNDPNDAR